MPPPPPPPATSAQAPVAGPQENTATPTPVSEFTTLRTHIQTLTELNNRLQAVRHIPAQLLRPSNLDKELLKMNLETTRHGFKELVTIAETVRSDKVQDALKAARRSELADPSNLGSNLRRENLKRRRPPSPESPQPYRETESKDTTSLPPLESGTVSVRLDGLPDYIRAHNKSSKSRLSIVAPKKGRKLECPVTLRLIVPNVVTVYLTLDHPAQDHTALIVENATAVGSREQKPPHSQSDFMAFQQLSQQFAKVIRTESSASLQAYVTLLNSYDRLFVDACSNCQRVISADGHVPPVVRKLLASSPDLKWDARHVLCKYEPPPPPPNPSENGAELDGDSGGSEPAVGGSAV
ncbi:hypothetical protein C8Q74DRAFT_1198625 [Fomes fomentarius]|nr:hypothetical protein C8Q74DRAFT_1198625 [Fomes fomentarius]